MIKNSIQTFCLLPSFHIFNYCYSYSRMRAQLRSAANKPTGKDVCKSVFVEGKRKDSIYVVNSTD
jgi:hypothetical protein